MECPSCKSQITTKDKDPECGNCGAYPRVNPDNGYVEWMKDGRIILNKEMEKESWEYWKKNYPKSFENAEKEGIHPS